MEILWVLVGSVWSVGLVLAGLWLGWTTRDRVGEAMKESPVSPLGSTEIQESPVTQEDFLATELPETRDAEWGIL